MFKAQAKENGPWLKAFIHSLTHLPIYPFISFLYSRKVFYNRHILKTKNTAVNHEGKSLISMSSHSTGERHTYEMLC